MPERTEIRQRRIALLFLSAGAVSFGFSGVLIKLCDFPSPVIASFRMILAGLAVAPFCLGQLKKFLRERGLAGFLLLLIPGLILGLHFQAWIMGLKRTYVASATFIISINPLFFALFERFLYKKRIPGYTYIALGMVLAGAYWLFATSGGQLGQSGDFLCLLSTLLFVIYLLVSRRVSGDVPHLLFIHVIYLWGGLLTLPFGLAGGGLARVDLTALGSVLALLGLALFPTLIGHTSINYGVRHLNPLTVSFFTLAEPIIASLTAALILSEIPPLREFPSYALFLGATVLYLVKSREATCDRRRCSCRPR
jgi:drug/metabolite transporter (DMT)-like permease